MDSIAFHNYDWSTGTAPGQMDLKGIWHAAASEQFEALSRAAFEACGYPFWAACMQTKEGLAANIDSKEVMAENFAPVGNGWILVRISVWPKRRAHTMTGWPCSNSTNRVKHDQEKMTVISDLGRDKEARGSQMRGTRTH